MSALLRKADNSTRLSLPCCDSCKNNFINLELTRLNCKRCRGGVIISHSVDTPTCGSGSSAKVKMGEWCAIERTYGTARNPCRLPESRHKSNWDSTVQAPWVKKRIQRLLPVVEGFPSYSTYSATNAALSSMSYCPTITKAPQ